MDDQYWSTVRTMRMEFADFLDTLSAQQWDAASLCAGWRVRDVVGHVSVVPRVTARQMLAVAPRARFDINGINMLIGIQEGQRDPQELVALLRRHAADRIPSRPVPDPRNLLFDLIVHGQDVARPLGRDLPVAAAQAQQGLERVWAMGWRFRARTRLGGLSLRATDTHWAAGTGPEVTGSTLALLLLATGRTTAVLDELHGPGVRGLASAA
ncbi:maleylpyruvate isomerase family mycothiol-dependent enzyme [uncultured Serinicoccus sp.]|uniref:maleylpyruvate isomerase family mycothiol-dependent enzyme n=1 Tax=uncultured Serinicoccus sp. TaxID=735514 RepID=UPI00262EC5CA|nr:maleylpyruvate isomerase family mycothiol-dependent enzyme [uncultured Serinicoccus sp.]